MSRSYCFTINNYDDINNYKDIQCRYCIIGEEIAPSTGTKHLLGYIEFNKVTTLKLCKKILNCNHAHLEKRKGSRDQAKTYCMKDNKYIEIGDWNIGGLGCRNDIKKILNQIKNNVNFIEIIENDPETYNKYRRTLYDYKSMLLELLSKHFRNVETTVLIGKPGTGKTSSVYNKHGFDNVYKLDFYEGNIWYDGYTGLDILLIDDFYGGIKYNLLLNILDGYPLRLPIKGSHTYANWSKIYITSNSTIPSWYKNIPNIDALMRRITNYEVLG